MFRIRLRVSQSTPNYRRRNRSEEIGRSRRNSGLRRTRRRYFLVEGRNTSEENYRLDRRENASLEAVLRTVIRDRSKSKAVSFSSAKGPRRATIVREFLKTIHKKRLNFAVIQIGANGQEANIQLTVNPPVTATTQELYSPRGDMSDDNRPDDDDEGGHEESRTPLDQHLEEEEEQEEEETEEVEVRRGPREELLGMTNVRVTVTELEEPLTDKSELSSTPSPLSISVPSSDQLISGTDLWGENSSWSLNMTEQQEQRPPAVEAKDVEDPEGEDGDVGSKLKAKGLLVKRGAPTILQRTDNDTEEEDRHESDNATSKVNLSQITPQYIEEERRWLRYRVEQLSREQCIIYCVLGHLVLSGEELGGLRNRMPSAEEARQALLCLTLGDHWDLANLTHVFTLADRIQTYQRDCVWS